MNIKELENKVSELEDTVTELNNMIDEYKEMYDDMLLERDEYKNALVDIVSIGRSFV